MAATYNATPNTIMYAQALLSEPIVIPAGGSVNLAYVVISKLPEENESGDSND